MKRRVLVLAVALIVLSVSGGMVLAGDTETLKGSFVWNNKNRTGDLEAVFTETGAGTWDVAFHFTWEGKPHTYAGTAEGSLREGKLSGKVVSDGEGKHAFAFAGSFEGGTFSGTHAHIGEDGKPKDTGTLTLER